MRAARYNRFVAREIRCTNCGHGNPDTDRYCGSCGSELPKAFTPVSAGEDGLYFCYRHKRETTRVTCGRCERPVCTRCMVMSSAGVRCPDCARNRTPVRMRGVLHDVGSGVGNAVGRRPIWYLWILEIVLSFFRGFFR